VTVDVRGDLVEALVSGAVAAAAVFAWAWGRRRGRFAIAGAAAALAWLAWHLYLQVSAADSLDIDNPALLGLSGEDAGTGVLAFLLAAVPLGLVTERDEPARRVILAAGIAAVVVTLIDLFV